MALIVTGGGGLCLLVGFIIVGHIVGSYDLDAVLAAGDLIRLHDLYLPALLLIFAGALTKSAIPVPLLAAQCHAARRLHRPICIPLRWSRPGCFFSCDCGRCSPERTNGFSCSGWRVCARWCSAPISPSFSRISRALAYSTISHLGLITMLLSFGSPLAAVAAIFHMMNHATFKASLFMAAGIIDHEAGTRDMRRLSGLFSCLPVTATLAMVASAAMAGVPLLNGFLSKEMFFAQAIETHRVSLLDSAAPYVATIAGAFAVTYSVRFIHTVFFGPRAVDLPRVPHEPPHWMRVPIELLVLACLIVGIVPGISIGPFLHVAAVSVLGERTPVYSLAVWHGFNYPLLMSVIAMVAGLLLYALLRRYLERCEEGSPGLRGLKGHRIFERVMATVCWRWARWLEAHLGTRRLQQQLRFLVATALLAVLWLIVETGSELRLPSPTGFDPLFAMIWAVGIACAVGAAFLVGKSTTGLPH